MSQILNRIRDVDANNSEAVKDALSVFFQNLLKFKEDSSSQWLRALESVITRFPKYCMTHRNTTETYLAHFLDSGNQQRVIEAAKCAHALQQVRPSLEKTATPKSSWRDQMTILCATAHKLLDAIFTNAVDVYKNGDYFQNKETEPVAAPTPLSDALLKLTELGSGERPVHSSGDYKTQLLSVRLRNVFIYIQAMLVEVYPVPKPIRPQTILNVTVRALAVSSGAGADSTRDVTDIKIQALRTIDALVTCMGSNLIPFSPLVLRLVMQTLRWSAESQTEEARKVRIVTYATLSLWLTTLRCHSVGTAHSNSNVGASNREGRSGFAEQLVTHVLSDVTPIKTAVTLTMNSQPTKNLSKKAKRKLANSMLMQSNISTHTPGEKHKLAGTEEVINEDLARAALECLESFIIVCGVFLKPTTYKLLTSRVIRACYSPPAPPLLLPLLRAAEALRRAPPPRAAPPTQHCLQVYAGADAADREVSRFCSKALLDIRLHLHCSPPSLSYSLERADMVVEERQNMPKQVSERNRVALEALLGAERMPNGVEEVTVTDGPCNKKPRIERESEKADNISVSSQSSIEISSDSDIQEIEVMTVDADTQENDVKVDDQVDSSKGIETAVTAVDDVKTIYEAVTQIPNISEDTVDEEVSPSIEVTYDYPSTGQVKVAVLEKMDDENLPSTNETDDLLTCGQTLKSSQEVSQKKVEEEPKVNGFAEEKDQNGDLNKENVALDSNVMVKIADGVIEVTVDDMLADFVDEVNDSAAVA